MDSYELIWFCNFICERQNPTNLASKNRTPTKTEDEDLMALGGFLIKKNYRHNYLSSK